MLNKESTRCVLCNHLYLPGYDIQPIIINEEPCCPIHKVPLK